MTLTNFPAVAQTLGDRALYQMLRASLELKDLAGASNALARILKLYPASDLADSSLLLVGEGLADARQPAAARALFRKFEEHVSQFPAAAPGGTGRRAHLRTGAGLARGHRRVRRAGWTIFPPMRCGPRPIMRWRGRIFRRATKPTPSGCSRISSRSFPPMISRPLAQWWVADYYFRLGGTNYMDAERNYKMLYQNTNWQGSPLVYTNLVYQARLMAGRAAMGLPSYTDAIDHFKSLTSDTNCPPELNAQALFAYGTALMQHGFDRHQQSAGKFSNGRRTCSIRSASCIPPTNPACWPGTKSATATCN